MTRDWETFVRQATRAQRPPRVPELLLQLADEMTPIWEATEDELGRQGIDPPFWAFAWAGGQAVARYLLDHPEEAHGRRVLDVASGSGVVGLAALVAGAVAVTALDIDPVAAAAARVNAGANGLVGLHTVTADVLGFLAGDGPGNDGPGDQPGSDEPGSEQPGYDLVVAGDVCYDRDMTPRVLELLHAARARGIRVLLGDPGRNYLPEDGLELLATYDVPTTADLEGREICPSRVFLIM